MQLQGTPSMLGVGMHSLLVPAVDPRVLTTMCPGGGERRVLSWEEEPLGPWVLSPWVLSPCMCPCECHAVSSSVPCSPMATMITETPMDSRRRR